MLGKLQRLFYKEVTNREEGRAFSSWEIIPFSHSNKVFCSKIKGSKSQILKQHHLTRVQDGMHLVPYSEKKLGKVYEAVDFPIFYQLITKENPDDKIPAQLSFLQNTLLLSKSLCLLNFKSAKHRFWMACMKLWKCPFPKFVHIKLWKDWCGNDP